MSNLMPPGWSAHQAPDGRYYYAHTSGTTQWHPPAPEAAGHASPPSYPTGAYGNHGGYTPGSHGGYASQPYADPKGSHGGQGSRPPGYPSGGQAQAYGAQGQGDYGGHGHGHGHGQGGYGGQAYGAGPAGSSHAMAAAASKFVYDRPMEFKLQEKLWSLSGDSFSIKDVATKAPVFKVKGNALSFRDSKALLDMNGTAIYKMTESLVSLRGRMQISDASTKQTVLTLRKKGFIPMLGTSTVLVWHGASDDGEPYLTVKGDFFRKDFDMKETASGRVVASVKRKSFTASNILFEKDSYVIRVEPGVDAALMVFMVIALDEQYRDDGNKKGYGSFLDVL